MSTGRAARIGLAGLALAAMLAAIAPAWASAKPQPTLAELLRRAEAGEVEAYDPLANFYLDAGGEFRDVAAAVRWLGAGIRAGDTDCMIDLGNLYFEGEDLDQDNDKALQLYEAAAAKGDALGAYNAGLVYEADGENLTRALDWYRRAAEAGDEGGMYKVAQAYQLGRGVTADASLAVAWMKRAADAGSLEAMNDLGSYYSEGSGVPVDEARALMLYMHAARQGSAIAMANVAVAYHNGEGVPVDFASALSWYALSARHGNLTAYYRLGLMYEAGEGVKASPAEALRFYRAAAESDDDDLRDDAEDAVERLEGGTSANPVA